MKKQTSNDALQIQERGIQKTFNKSSHSVNIGDVSKEPSKTVKEHVRIIQDANVNSAIDVGSGAGRLLLELFNSGIEVGVGVDLSEEMNEIARKRFEDAEIDKNRFTIIDGSFLDINQESFPQLQSQYEAVSLNLVLCCHPDRKAMIEQTVTFKPKVIALSLPRPWVILKLVVWVWGRITKFTGGFRPYIHSQKSIDNQLLNLGYYLKERKKTFGMVISSYYFAE